MDEIVAVIRLTNGEERFLLTWGRVFGAVDDRLIETVSQHLNQFALGGETRSIEVCESLQAAAGSKYFFESFFAMCQKTVPLGPGYEEWMTRTRALIEAGRELYYLGSK